MIDGKRLVDWQQHNALQVIVTLLIGTVGAAIATWAGLPAAALIGSTLAVSAASVLRLPTNIPGWLRNMAFAAIGCTLGSGVDGELLELAVKWPLSLCGLVLAMAAILAAGCRLLTSVFNQSRETAVLATSPGALSYSLAIAATGVGDASAIIVIQSVRLLCITTALPLVLDLFNLEHGNGGGVVREQIPLAATAALFLLTLGIGYVLHRKRLPAAFLIVGVVVSGILHYCGVVSGRPQSGFLITGFVITGSVIGARFSHIPLREIRRLVVASLALVIVSSAIAAGCAAVAANLLGMPFGQVWVAYAPGGVEAMAAMALALDYDSAFVAFHHLFRILSLILLLPFLLQFFRRSASTETSGRI